MNMELRVREAAPSPVCLHSCRLSPSPRLARDWNGRAFFWRRESLPLTLRCAFNSSSNWFISDWIVNRGFKKNYYYNLPFNWRVTSPGSIPPSPSSSAATSLKTSVVENYFKIQSKPRSKPFFETQRHFFNMNAMDSTRVTLNHIIMFWLIIISVEDQSIIWMIADN